MKLDHAPFPSGDPSISGIRSLRFLVGALLLATAATCELRAQDNNTDLVNVSFENGSADYPGHFYNTISDSGNVTLSNNGADENNYLVFTGQAAMAYSTNGNSTVNTYQIAAGQSDTLSVEIQTTTDTNNGSVTLGFYNPSSTSGNFAGMGFTVYLNSSTQYTYTEMATNTVSYGTRLQTGLYTSPTANDMTIRLVTTLTNNATDTGGTLSTSIYEISGFGGSITATILNGTTQTLVYGTGNTTPGTININPASGLGIFVNDGVGAAGYADNVDNLVLTADAIPEPSTVALLMGVAGLAFVVVRRRTR